MKKLAIALLLCISCQTFAAPKTVSKDVGICWTNPSTRENGSALTLYDLRYTTILIDNYTIANVPVTSSTQCFRRLVQDYRPERIVGVYSTDVKGLKSRIAAVRLGGM